MIPKPQEVQKTPVSEVREREHSSRLSALSNFSISDMFRDGSKSVKFPEKLIKVLEQKLQDIAMGKDAAYVFTYSRDLFPHAAIQIFRPACAANYGQVLWTIHG